MRPATLTRIPSARHEAKPIEFRTASPDSLVAHECNLWNRKPIPPRHARALGRRVIVHDSARRTEYGARAKTARLLDKAVKIRHIIVRCGEGRVVKGRCFRAELGGVFGMCAQAVYDELGDHGDLECGGEEQAEGDAGDDGDVVEARHFGDPVRYVHFVGCGAVRGLAGQAEDEVVDDAAREAEAHCDGAD